MGKAILAILGIGLAGASAYIAFNYKHWMNALDYGMNAGLKMNRISGKETVITIPMWFFNPTPIPFIISNLDLDVFIDGRNVGKITTKSYKISANQKNDLNLTIAISNVQLVQSIIASTNAFSDIDWREKTDVRVKGTVGVYVGVLFIQKLPIDFTEKAAYYLS